MNTDSNCNFYDTFTGKCYKCKIPTWTVIGNTCTPPNINANPNSAATLNCGAGTYKKGNKCIPIGCSAAENNICTKCEPAYELKGDSCELKVCGDVFLLKMATG